MYDNKQKQGDDMSAAGGFFAGLLFGGLAGAGAMLLFAPQSGKRTRAQIQRQGRELRDHATDSIQDTMAQARIKAHQINADVRDQVGELQERGQNIFTEQKDRLVSAVEAGKKAVQGSRN